MNKNEYVIGNKSVPIGSLAVAGLYIVFMVFTAIVGYKPLNVWELWEIIVFALALVAIAVDCIDLYKIKQNKLIIRFEEEGIRIYSYVFSMKYYLYSEITNVNLREKDIELKVNDKLKVISGPSQSNLIRMMKALNDRIN